MSMLATLHRSGGIVAVARHTGNSPAVAAACVQALLPDVLGGFRRFARRGQGPGLRTIVAMLDELGDGNLAAEVMGPDAVHVASGNAVLDKLFPASAERHNVVETASLASGLERGIVEHVLPLLVMLIGGYISARAHALSGGAIGDATRLSDILADDVPNAAPPPAGFGERI